MNKAFIAILSLILAIVSVESFVPSSSTNELSRRTSTSLNFFGEPKDDGSPGDYVCKDCGYVFTKGPAAWAKLDKDKYQCPPCGAPKFRFKKVPKGSASGKKVEVKK